MRRAAEPTLGPLSASGAAAGALVVPPPPRAAGALAAAAAPTPRALPAATTTPMRPAGVTSYDVSLEKQQVVVKGDVTPEAVLETVRKTGKKAELVK
jgi:hypothetical protein